MKQMQVDRNTSRGSHDPNKGTHRRRIAMVAAMCYLTTVPEGAAQVIKTHGGIHTIGLMLEIARQEEQGLKKAYLGACLMNISRICGTPEFSPIVARELEQDDAAHIIDLLLRGETHIFMYGVYAIMGLARVHPVSIVLGKLNAGHALCTIGSRAIIRLQKYRNTLNAQPNKLGQAQRDMQLVEAVSGALAMLSMCASNKLHLVESGALGLCANVLLLPIATDCALQMCVNCIWHTAVKESKWGNVSGDGGVCDRVQKTVQKAIIDLGLPKVLSDRVRNLCPTSIHLRVLAMNLFEVMATSKYAGSDTIAQSGGNPDVLEEYYLDLVRARTSTTTPSATAHQQVLWEKVRKNVVGSTGSVNFGQGFETGTADDLQECGAKGLARRALLPGRKKVIAEGGGMQALMDLMALEDASNAVLCKAAHALMNLTASPKLQVSKAVRKGVATLVQHAVNPRSKELHMFTIRILKNMSRHHLNRTLLYREELRLKAHAAAEAAQRQRAYEVERRRALMDPYGSGVIRADDLANRIPEKEPEMSELEKTRKLFGDWLSEAFGDVQPNTKLPTSSQRPDVKSAYLQEYEKTRPLLELEKPRVSLMQRRSKGKKQNTSRLAGKRVRPATARSYPRRPNASSAGGTNRLSRPSTAYPRRGDQQVSSFVRPKSAAPASTVDLSQLLRKSMTSTWYDPTGEGTSPRGESAIRGIFSGPIGPLPPENFEDNQMLNYTPRMPPTPRPQTARRHRTASSRWRNNTTPNEAYAKTQVPDLRLSALETSTNFLQPITDDSYGNEWGWDNWTPRITSMRMNRKGAAKHHMQRETEGRYSKEKQEEGLLHVMLRPQSARSRFVFNRRPYRPAPNIVKRRGGSVKVTSHRTVTENINGTSIEATEAELKSKEDDNVRQRRREEQSYKVRPVRLWKWNHVKGSSALANFQTYSIPISAELQPESVVDSSRSEGDGDTDMAVDEGGVASRRDGGSEEKKSDEVGGADTKIAGANSGLTEKNTTKNNGCGSSDLNETTARKRTSPAGAGKGGEGSCTCSFFNLVRIHEAESPLANPQNLERLIFEPLGQDTGTLHKQLMALLVSPRLPVLHPPSYKSLPPAPLPKKQHILGPTTTFVTPFSDALRLEARPIKREVPLFSLKSLMRANALRPKHPTLKAFKARRIIADSRAMCESPDMYRRAFAADWARLEKKRKTLWTTLGICGSGKEREDHEIEWVRRAFVKHYKIIFHAYMYYACLDGDSSDAFTMSLSELRQCLKDCGFLKVNAKDPVSVRLLHDIDIVFIRTNIEERVDQNQKAEATRKKKNKKHHLHHKHRRRSSVKGMKKVKKKIEHKDKDDDAAEMGEGEDAGDEKSLEELERQERENEVNPDRGLMRFEFVELILRLSVRAANTIQEVKSKTTKKAAKERTAAENLDAFCAAYLGSKLPPRARFHHDVWRCNRLYTERMDHLLQNNRSWLIELFQRYCDYSYEFEKKTGKKHFTKSSNVDVAALSVAMVEDGSAAAEGRSGSPAAVGIDAESIASNSTTKSKKKKKRHLHHGKKGKKKKRTFVSSLLPMKGWLKFLRDAKLIGGKETQVTNRDAALLFVYSKMGIVEEVEHRFLFVRMNECSFFEALARLAEYLRVPTDQEIEHDERVRMAALAAAAPPPENSDAAKEAKEAKQEKEQETRQRRMHTVLFKKLDRLAVFGDRFTHDAEGGAELVDRLAPLLEGIKWQFGISTGVD
jgi:hypothetical protein